MEQPKQEQGEPVAWANDDWSRIDFPSGKVPTKGGAIYTEPQSCPNCASLEAQNTELDAKLAEQEQGEPVGEAYLCDKCSTPFDGGWECPSCGHDSSTKEPVYTTPQQRTWVGLTDDEIDKAWRSVDYTVPWEQHRIDIARAIEAKLKEKNT